MTDWFEDGKRAVINDVSENTGISHNKVEAVYSALVNIGLIDYDVEKEIFYDWANDD